MTRSMTLAALAIAVLVSGLSHAEARGFGRGGGFHGGGFHGGGFHGGGLRGPYLRPPGMGGAIVVSPRMRLAPTTAYIGEQRICTRRHWRFDAFGNPVALTYMCR